MISKAARFAEKAHKGQYRKFEGQPFVEHPKRVATFVESTIDADEQTATAALLHDTVEDTNATLSEIAEHFGTTVASLVRELTTDKEKAEEIGKANYLGHKMVNMSDTALTIKLCDRYHNVHRIEETPDHFRIRYKKETKEIITFVLENRTLTSAQKRIANSILEKVS